MCAPCRLKMLPKAKAVSYAYQIPIQEFTAPSSRCKFKVLFCTSKKKVNEALSVIKLENGQPLVIASMEQMEKLADYHDQGFDKTVYGVDVNQLLDKLDISQEEIQNAECNLACTF